MRLVRVEGEEIALPGDVLLAPAGQFTDALLDEADQVVVVEMVREWLQHVLEPVGFSRQISVVVDAPSFLDHVFPREAPIYPFQARTSCTMLLIGEKGGGGRKAPGEEPF